MDLDERISRFEALVAEEPDNDMAIFSLAGAYNQAGRYSDAAETYKKAIGVNPGLSKAYQLAGAAYMADQKTEEAAAVLTEGFKVAAERGDRMPQQAMGDLLDTLGVAHPEVAKPKAETNAAPPGTFVCGVTGKPGTKLPKPPFRGKLGEWIQNRASKETFDEWIGLGTKIINELKLDLSRDEHDAVYDYAMRKYLGLTDEVYQELVGAEPPQAEAEYRGVIDQILGRQGDLEQYQGQLHDSVEP